MIEALWFHAQLLFIDGSLLHGVCHHLDIQTQQLSRILSREPPQRFSCFSAVFFPKDGLLWLTSKFSQKSLFHRFLLSSHSLSMDSFPPQRFGHASHLYLPSRHEHYVSSVFSRLLLQLPIDLHTTPSLFISHNYNFSSNVVVRAEPSQTDSAPNITFINNP